MGKTTMSEFALNISLQPDQLEIKANDPRERLTPILMISYKHIQHPTKETKQGYRKHASSKSR